jgi:protein-tyrosine phosphatase
VRRIVDLQHEDPPYGAPVEVVRVPLFDAAAIAEIDQPLLGVDDATAWRARQYPFFLERFQGRFAEAVCALVADGDHTVLEHCAGGIDRTGLVSALVLRLAGVETDTVARDYAESEANWASSVGDWIAESPDEAERRKRGLLSVMPAAAMRTTLEALEERHGSSRSYLLGGGADAAALDRLAERLSG